MSNLADVSSHRDLPPYPGVAQGVWTLVVLVVAFLVSYLDRNVLGLMVTPVKISLKISDFEISLLVGLAFSLFYAIFGIPTGRMADRFNRKRLIVGGIILWSFATLSCGLVTSFFALFLCRMAIGVGESALGPASYSMLGDLFEPRKLVRATSILSLAATLSAGLALIADGKIIAFATRASALPLGLMNLAPWQRTFVLVSIPGFAMAVLLLAIREPQRRGQAPEHKDNESGVFAYLWEHRRLYTPIYLCGTGMAAMLANGLQWFPTHLIRTFGDTPAQAGVVLGTIQIVGAVVGTFLGLAITEIFFKRGYSDAPLRTVMVTAAITAVTAAVFLVPARPVTIFLWLISSIFQNSYYGNVVAALQIATPSRARGTTIAFLYFGINVIGFGVGSALIGAISDHLFPGVPRGIGYGLAIVGGGGTLVASYAAWRSLPHFRRARAMLESDG